MPVSICLRVRSGRLDSHSPCITLMPCRLAISGNLVEAVIGRIGAHAVGDLLELGEVFLDLPGIDRNVRAERVLVAAERRVGDAMHLLARRQRRLRHFDLRAEPSPDGDDRGRRHSEEHETQRPSAAPVMNGVVYPATRGSAKPASAASHGRLTVASAARAPDRRNLPGHLGVRRPGCFNARQQAPLGQ